MTTAGNPDWMKDLAATMNGSATKNLTAATQGVQFKGLTTALVGMQFKGLTTALEGMQFKGLTTALEGMQLKGPTTALEGMQFKGIAEAMQGMQFKGVTTALEGMQFKGVAAALNSGLDTSAFSMLNSPLAEAAATVSRMEGWTIADTAAIRAAFPSVAVSASDLPSQASAAIAAVVFEPESDSLLEAAADGDSEVLELLRRLIEVTEEQASQSGPGVVPVLSLCVAVFMGLWAIANSYAHDEIGNAVESLVRHLASR